MNGVCVLPGGGGGGGGGGDKFRLELPLILDIHVCCVLFYKGMQFWLSNTLAIE